MQVQCSFGPIYNTNNTNASNEWAQMSDGRFSETPWTITLPCLRPVTGYIVGEMRTKTHET